MAFADHRDFTKHDIHYILRKATDYEYVVTTEKDYMRFLQHPDLLEVLADKLHVLPIQTDFGVDKDAFDRQILLYVSENNRRVINQ